MTTWLKPPTRGFLPATRSSLVSSNSITRPSGSRRNTDRQVPPWLTSVVTIGVTNFAPFFSRIGMSSSSLNAFTPADRYPRSPHPASSGSGLGSLSVCWMISTAAPPERFIDCLLYTSDAADDLLCVDLGGRRIIKKKKKKKKNKKKK